MENRELRSNPEYGEFKIGDIIEWIDDATKNQFTAPAFGYGPGPFEILNIKHRSAYSVIEIDTPKGKKELNSVYFKVKGS